MENPKQTTSPNKEKKWWHYPMVISIFVLLVASAYLLEGEYHGQVMPSKDNYAAMIQDAQTAFNQKEEAKKQAEVDSCEALKALAHLNIQQHNDSPVEYPLSAARLIDLDQKQSKDCGTGNSLIPVAKALSFESAGIQAKPAQKHPIMIKGSTQQQTYIDYAWNTYHDKSLVYLMKAENGLITPDRKHLLTYWCAKRKTWGNDWGFGGTSDCYHHEVTSDPRFFTDWKWQIDQVYKLYKGGTTFHSRKNWPAMSQYFNWV